MAEVLTHIDLDYGKEAYVQYNCTVIMGDYNQDWLSLKIDYQKVNNSITI